MGSRLVALQNLECDGFGRKEDWQFWQMWRLFKDVEDDRLSVKDCGRPIGTHIHCYNSLELGNGPIQLDHRELRSWSGAARIPRSLQRLWAKSHRQIGQLTLEIFTQSPFTDYCGLPDSLSPQPE